MATPSGSFGVLIAGARLSNPGPKLAYTHGMHLVSGAGGLSEYNPAPGDKGWRVTTTTAQGILALASVSLESQPGTDADIFPRVTPGPFMPGSGLAWDVYLVDATGAVVDAATMAATSGVVLTIHETDAEAGIAP